MASSSREYKAFVTRELLNSANERKPSFEEIVIQKLTSVGEELKVEELLDHVSSVIKMKIDESIRSEVNNVLIQNDGKRVIHTRHGYWKIKK